MPEQRRKARPVAGEAVPDAELVQRFRNGDQHAFDEIVLKYQNRLIRAARGLLGNEHAAMDASQDTFVQAYRHLGGFRGESGLFTWLYRILHNRCLSIRRHEAVIPFVSADDDDMPEAVYSGPDPGEETERRGFRRAVETALVGLPERQRVIFEMRQFEGLTHHEIGDLLGITEGAVKSSYFHAVRKLQQELEPWNRD